MFVERGRKLVSCSKDEHVRVWDLDTQSCVQTVVGHRGEVWALDVDPGETRLATGSADAELRVYAIGGGEGRGAEGEQEGAQEGAAAPGGGEYLTPMGCLRRQTADRAEMLRYGVGAGGTLLLTCQSAGKVAEVYRVRGAAEAQRRYAAAEGERATLAGRVEEREATIAQLRQAQETLQQALNALEASHGELKARAAEKERELAGEVAALGRERDALELERDMLQRESEGLARELHVREDEIRAAHSHGTPRGEGERRRR